MKGKFRGLLEGFFLEKGARGPAYNSIVASGDNACILHYTTNNSPLKKKIYYWWMLAAHLLIITMET